jgi:hypothetical protein
MTEQELMLRARARLRAAEAAQRAAAQQQQQEPLSTEETETLPTNPRDWAQRGIDQQRQGSAALGLADAGLSVVSGIPGSIIGGASAAVDLVRKGDWQSASDVYDNVSQFFQYSPKTERGQKILEKVGEVVEPVQTKARDANIAMVGEDNPALATAVETFVLGLPEIFMGAKLPGQVAARRAMGKPKILKDMDDAAKRLGLDLNNNTVKESVVEAARRMAGDSARATSGAEDLHTGLSKAEEASRKAVNAEFTLARSKEAQLDLDPIIAMTRKAEKDLIERGADLGEETVLAKRLKELENIRETVIGQRKGKDARQIPGQSSTILGPDSKPLVAAADTPVRIPLDELEVMNQRLTSDMKTAYGTGRNGDADGLRVLRQNINDMLDEQFNNDMIHGDKSAKDQWIKARLANRMHKERFSDDKVIRDLVANNRTAKDTVKLIFGASEVGHRAEAFRVVKKLKEILGPNANELQSLSISAFADMFEPLFKETPNWNGALERIRRARRDDLPLLAELDMSENDLNMMERAIRVARDVKVKADFDGKGFFSQMIARFGFGHDIAVGGAKMKIANMVLDKALGVGQKTHDQLLKEFAGIQSGGPLLAPTDPRVRSLNLNAMGVSEWQNAGEDPTER